VCVQRLDGERYEGSWSLAANYNVAVEWRQLRYARGQLVRQPAADCTRQRYTGTAPHAHCGRSRSDERRVTVGVRPRQPGRPDGGGLESTAASTHGIHT
jgi:hypothetical protein